MKRRKSNIVVVKRKGEEFCTNMDSALMESKKKHIGNQLTIHIRCAFQTRWLHVVVCTCTMSKQNFFPTMMSIPIWNVPLYLQAVAPVQHACQTFALMCECVYSVLGCMFLMSLFGIATATTTTKRNSTTSKRPSFRSYKQFFCLNRCS